jgi:diguanylate cyclase (GGDEF)-like protein
MESLLHPEDAWPRLSGARHSLPASTSPRLSAAAEPSEQIRRVEILVEHDELTHLLSRRAFVESARAVVERLRRDPQRRAWWAMIDLDHFRSITRRHGQAAGDRLLLATAALVRLRLGNLDTPSYLGRLRGDEIAVLLEGPTQRQTLRLLNHVRKEFAAAEHDLASRVPLRATLSAGVAALGAGMDVERWHERAERALCVAKVAGRNRVELIG